MGSLPSKRAKVLKRHFWALFLVIGASHCATSRVIEPLPAGTGRAEASIGGPLSTFTSHLPAPMISLAYAYGIHERVSVFGGANISAAIYGNVLLDPGATLGIVRPKKLRPGLSITGVANTLVTLRYDKSLRVYPEVDANVYWRVPWGSIYASFGNWFDPLNSRSTGPEAKVWVPVATLGQRLDFGGPWKPVGEIRYMGGNVRTDSVEENQAHGIGGRGAIGLYLGLGWEH